MRSPFQLQMPITWPHIVWSRFNDPRNYSHINRNVKQAHEGIDFAPSGDISEPLYVRASNRGRVTAVANYPKGYGRYIRIEHWWGNERYVTWYGHLAHQFVTIDQFVAAGEIIGIAGNTGFSTGTHLHLTLQHIGNGLDNYVVADVVDPEPYLVPELSPFDEMWWVEDVTIPDGTVMPPGTTFPKVWRVLNAGTTTWRDYHMIYVAHERMNGAAAVPIPVTQPGDTAKIRVDLTSPSAPGHYRSTWKPRNARGRIFDYAMYADIVVKGHLLDEARFVQDVTIPDGLVLQAGSHFKKVWRIRNSGQTTWGAGYALAFFADERMGGPDFVPLPQAKPGDVVDVAVDLIAPIIPGRYRSTWKPRNPQGDFFEFTMWVDIRVVE